MWPDYCESCFVTERQAVVLIFNTRLWGLHSESERWGGGGGGGCEFVNWKFLYKTSKTLKLQLLIEQCGECAKRFFFQFLCLFISFCVCLFFLHTPASSLCGVCLSLSSSLFLIRCLFRSLDRSLTGWYPPLQLGCTKLWSTCQESNSTANSQTGAQRDQDACTHTHTP